MSSEETIRDAIAAAFTDDGFTVGGAPDKWPTDIAAPPVVLSRTQRLSRLTRPILTCAMVTIAERIDKAGLRKIVEAADDYVLGSFVGGHRFRDLGKTGLATIPVIISPGVDQSLANRVQRRFSLDVAIANTVLAPVVVDVAASRVYYERFGPGLVARLPLNRLIQRNVVAPVSAV